MSFIPYLEAEYEDGFVLREDEQDHSPYDSGRNIFHAILNKRPEPIHGPMVELRLIGPEKTYTINWREVPEGAKPIRFKHFEHTWVHGISQGQVLTGLDFGYQYRDSEGRKQEQVLKL